MHQVRNCSSPNLYSSIKRVTTFVVMSLWMPVGFVCNVGTSSFRRDRLWQNNTASTIYS